MDHRAGALSGEGRYLLSNRRLHGRADVRRINLADRSLASWLPGMPRTSLSGELRGEARFDTAGAEATVFGNLVVSEIFGRSPGPVSFGVQLHQRRVTIDSLRVGTPGTGFFAQGWWAIDTGLCEATAHLGGVRLDDWVEPFVGIGFAGTSRGTLSLNGDISSPTSVATSM